MSGVSIAGVEAVWIPYSVHTLLADYASIACLCMDEVIDHTLGA